jgi:glucose dehydrogenase
VRNLAIYDDKLFMTTGDAHALALDARTGKVVWDVAVANASLGFTAQLQGTSNFLTQQLSKLPGSAPLNRNN